MARPAHDEPGVVFATVPCHLMRGTVQVKDPTSISQLHFFTLKAISVNGDLKAVLDAFGIGRRIMQGVLTDLFYDGLIYLNLQDGKVVLSPAVSQALTRGSLEDLLGMRAPKEITITWVQETVSGGIMAFPLVRKYLSQPEYVSTSIPLTAKPGRIPALKDFPVRTLVRAARRVLEEMVPAGGDIIDRVERISDRQAVGGRLFYVPIQVIHSGPNQPPLFLPEVEGVPRGIVDAWTAVLNPDREAFDLLDRARTAKDPLRALSPQGLADEWESLMESVHKMVEPGGQRKVEPLDFAEAADDLGDLAQRIAEAREGAHEVDVVSGPAALHFSTLGKMIAEAKKLVVIGSAFLNLETLSSFAPLLIPALERGVGVVLLWGLADTNERESETRLLGEASRLLDEWMDRTGTETGGGAWIVPSASPFHSKFVAIDGTVGSISSLNWLSSKPSGQIWEATAILQGGRIPVELLSYALERIPGEHPCRPLLESALSAQQSANASHGDQDPTAGVVAELKAVLGELGNGGDGSLRSAAEALVKRAEPIASSIREARSVVLVRDADHRRLLTSSLASAKDRLAITSDRIREEGAGRVFARLAADALRRGVSLVIRWGREVPGGDLDDDARRSRLLAGTLKAELGTRCDINAEPAGVHGKVILEDSSLALVSSFNFLAFGGTAGAEQTLSGELGVAIFDSNVVRTLEQSLGEHGTASQ